MDQWPSNKRHWQLIMKKEEIVVGGVYRVQLSGKFTDVRVDSIGKTETFRSSGIYGTRRTTPSRTVYGCTNLSTGRQVTIRSATKFRREVKSGVAISSKFAQDMIDGKWSLNNPELDDYLERMLPADDDHSSD